MRFDPSFFVLFPVFVLSIVAHECAHGVVALWCGDSTARDRGRLTLNPLPHVDPVGSLLVPALLLLTRSSFLFGWAKPVPIEWANLRHPRNDQIKVALAGPASNALLALGFAAVLRVSPERGFFAPVGIAALYGVVINCALGLFNLIPIPPLDGSWILMRFLRLRHIIALQRYRFVGMLLLVVMLSQPTISRVVFVMPLRVAVTGYLGLFGMPAPQGL